MLSVLTFQSVASTDYNYLSNYTLQEWRIDNNNFTNSVPGGYTLIDGSTTTNTTGIIESGRSFNANSDYLNSTYIFNVASYTTCGWVYGTGNYPGSVGGVLDFDRGSDKTVNTFDVYQNKYRWTRTRAGIASDCGSQYGDYAPNRWFFFCLGYDGARVNLWINATLLNNCSSTGSGSTAKIDTYKFGYNQGSFSILGTYDQIYHFNKTLTQDEVSFLYNLGAPGSEQQYDFKSPAPASTIQNITFTAKNILNTAYALTNYSLTFNNNGSVYSTTNGTIILNNFNVSDLLNISLTNASNHYNINYSNLNVSAGSYIVYANNSLNMTSPGITNPTAQNYAYNQTININWTATISYYGASISSYNISLLNSDNSFNATLNGSNTGLSQILDLSLFSGSFKIKVEAKDNFNLTNIGLSSIFNITSVLNVRLQNAYNLSYVNNFSGYVILSDGSSQTYTTSTGTANINIYSGLNQIYITSPGYSITSANYFNFTLNATPQTYNKTIQLYTNNSIYIEIKDETTYNLITSNVSIQVDFNNATIGTYYTTSGIILLENLSDGAYSLVIGGSGTNYTARTYAVSVASGSTQSLTAYLSSSITPVLFVIADSLSSAILEGATISFYRYINATLTLIEVKDSDITGRAQFYYIPGSHYRIIVQKSGYTSKSFDLNPILFASYDVYLSKNIVYIYTGSLEDVKIIYTPRSYYNNEISNFTFIISSSTGVLNNYGVNISYPCGNYSFNGNNSIGETFNQAFTISCAGFRDLINITYYYESVGNPVRVYYDQYFIGGTYSASNYTFINLRKSGDTFGLGILERILIVTILGLIVAGITYLMIGGEGAVVLCLLVFSYFTYTGFIPLWSVIISFLSGIFLLLGRDN
jgi:hypothetical protein